MNPETFTNPAGKISSSVNLVLLTYSLVFFRATKNIVRFSHENVRMHPVFKEFKNIAMRIDFYLSPPYGSLSYENEMIRK